jgi:hypothetical protein
MREEKKLIRILRREPVAERHVAHDDQGDAYGAPAIERTDSRHYAARRCGAGLTVWEGPAA